MSIHQVSDGSDESSCVQVTVYADPGSLIVYWVEGVELIVEEQQLLAVAAGSTVDPLLLSIDPVRSISSKDAPVRYRAYTQHNV